MKKFTTERASCHATIPPLSRRVPSLWPVVTSHGNHSCRLEQFRHRHRIFAPTPRSPAPVRLEVKETDDGALKDTGAREATEALRKSEHSLSYEPDVQKFVGREVAGKVGVSNMQELSALGNEYPAHSPGQGSIASSFVYEVPPPPAHAPEAEAQLHRQANKRFEESNTHMAASPLQKVFGKELAYADREVHDMRTGGKSLNRSSFDPDEEAEREEEERQRLAREEEAVETCFGFQRTMQRSAGPKGLRTTPIAHRPKRPGPVAAPLAAPLAAAVPPPPAAEENSISRSKSVSKDGVLRAGTNTGNHHDSANDGDGELRGGGAAGEMTTSVEPTPAEPTRPAAEGFEEDAGGEQSRSQSQSRRSSKESRKSSSVSSSGAGEEPKQERRKKSRSKESSKRRKSKSKESRRSRSSEDREGAEAGAEETSRALSAEDPDVMAEVAREAEASAAAEAASDPAAEVEADAQAETIPVVPAPAAAEPITVAAAPALAGAHDTSAISATGLRGLHAELQKLRELDTTGTWAQPDPVELELAEKRLASEQKEKQSVAQETAVATASHDPNETVRDMIDNISSAPDAAVAQKSKRSSAWATPLRAFGAEGVRLGAAAAASQPAPAQQAPAAQPEPHPAASRSKASNSASSASGETITDRLRAAERSMSLKPQKRLGSAGAAPVVAAAPAPAAAVAASAATKPQDTESASSQSRSQSNEDQESSSVGLRVGPISLRAQTEYRSMQSELERRNAAKQRERGQRLLSLSPHKHERDQAAGVEHGSDRAAAQRSQAEYDSGRTAPGGGPGVGKLSLREDPPADEEYTSATDSILGHNLAKRLLDGRAVLGEGPLNLPDPPAFSGGSSSSGGASASGSSSASVTASDSQTAVPVVGDAVAGGAGTIGRPALTTRHPGSLSLSLSKKSQSQSVSKESTVQEVDVVEESSSSLKATSDPKSKSSSGTVVVDEQEPAPKAAGAEEGVHSQAAPTRRGTETQMRLDIADVDVRLRHPENNVAVSPDDWGPDARSAGPAEPKLPFPELGSSASASASPDQLAARSGMRIFRRRKGSPPAAEQVPPAPVSAPQAEEDSVFLDGDGDADVGAAADESSHDKQNGDGNGQQTEEAKSPRSAAGDDQSKFANISVVAELSPILANTGTAAAPSAHARQYARQQHQQFSAPRTSSVAVQQFSAAHFSAEVDAIEKSVGGAVPWPDADSAGGLSLGLGLDVGSGGALPARATAAVTPVRTSSSVSPRNAGVDGDSTTPAQHERSNSKDRAKAILEGIRAETTASARKAVTSNSAFALAEDPTAAPVASASSAGPQRTETHGTHAAPLAAPPSFSLHDPSPALNRSIFQKARALLDEVVTPPPAAEQRGRGPDDVEREM